jgi:hypothetical protein
VRQRTRRPVPLSAQQDVMAELKWERTVLAERIGIAV